MPFYFVYIWRTMPTFQLQTVFDIIFPWEQLNSSFIWLGEKKDWVCVITTLFGNIKIMSLKFFSKTTQVPLNDKKTKPTYRSGQTCAVSLGLNPFKNNTRTHDSVVKCQGQRHLPRKLFIGRPKPRARPVVSISKMIGLHPSEPRPWLWTSHWRWNSTK